MGYDMPFSPVMEGGLSELIGINEQIDQNDYTGSVTFTVPWNRPVSGEILSVCFYSTEDGSGSVIKPQGLLLVFDADPNPTAGDTALTAAEWVTAIGKIPLETSDWETDANGGLAFICDYPVPFHDVSALYFVFKLKSAGSFNDAAGDDEQLEFNFWYRRES